MEPSLPDSHVRLAARLRGLRAERGLTLDGLAERAGVSRSMISLVERGESSPTAFRNPAGRAARYVVALAADPAPVGHRGVHHRGSAP